MATAANNEPAKKPEKREYLHVVMAHHPTHGKAVPIATFDNEEEAWRAAANGNKEKSHLGYHVKRVPKGG